MGDLPELKGTVIWLLPDEEGFRDCRNLIHQLAKQNGTPPFDPHLTLCRPDQNLSDTDLADAASRFARSHPPLKADVGPPECGEPPFQRFFLPVLNQNPFKKMLSHTPEFFGAEPFDDVRFHLSLLYGSIPCPDIQRVNSTILKELYIQHIAVVRINGLPSEWHITQRYPLGK